MNSKELNFFFTNLKEICPLLSNCKQGEGKNCMKYHPRCFSGICINFLNSNCKLAQCPLQHLTQEQCKIELSQPEINGVYRINLCPNSENCKSPDDCGYLHRKWIEEEKICLQYFAQKCKQISCKRTHLSWEELEEKVYKEQNQEGFVPRNLCEKQECKCKHHLTNLKGFCITNFKGVCQSKGKCPRVHCDWEDSKDIKPYQILKQKAYPCCIQVQNTQQTIQVEIQQKFLAFFKQNDMLKIQTQLKEQNVVDLLLIMDLTDSMQEWIDSVKNNIYIIIDKFKKIIPNVEIRIAFVGYRDFWNEENHIVFHEFTPEVKKIKEFIEKQNAEDGEDCAEDLAGGLEKALQLNFSKHPDSVLCTFLFCDAPTHGRQYHNLGFEAFDQKIDSIEKGSLEKIMIAFKQIKRNNFFSCCKIRSCTEKMFQIMQENFEGLIISEFSTNQLTDHIAFTLVNSFQASQFYKQVKEQKIRISATYLRHKLIQPKFWIKTENLDEIDHEANFQHQLGLNIIRGDTVLEIDVNPINLSNDEKGACSEIFRIFDIRNNRKLIAKIPRKIYLKFKDQYKKNPAGILKLDEKDFKQSKSEAYHRYYSTLIAQQFAVGYRDKSRKIENALPIFYVSPIIYALCQQFYSMEVLYAETEIDLPEEKWEKITNNAALITKGNGAYGAFSHLSFGKSNKRLMITDLQGKGGIFSDPAIHIKSKQEDEDCKVENDKSNVAEESVETECTDTQAQQNDKNTKYYSFLQASQTDCGLSGIQNFFDNQHKKCNELCKEFKLNRKIFYTKDNEKSGEDTGNEIIKAIKRQFVNCICDICGNQYKISYDDYKDNENNQFYCNQCSNSTKREDICECCGDKFPHHHERTLRMGQVPTLCEHCDKCKEAQKKCYYCEAKCTKIEFHEIDMSGIKNLICHKGYEYFEQLQCERCNKPYDQKEWPSKEEYKSDKYQCKTCLKKK